MPVWTANVKHRGRFVNVTDEVKCYPAQTDAYKPALINDAISMIDVAVSWRIYDLWKSNVWLQTAIELGEFPGKIQHAD